MSATAAWILLPGILPLALPLSAQGPGAATARPAAISPAEKVELAALLPVPASFGFTPKGDAQFYSSDLGDYLDGAAEAYHQYGLAAMVHQAYQSRAAEVTVDLYDMADPLNAFGIYAAERLPDCRYVEIGGEACATDASLSFFQRQYYVKISTTGARALLEILAKYVSQKIWTGADLPGEIAWFPARGMVPHTQKYLARSPMGRDYLAPAATAEYRFGGRETTLLVSIAASPQEAAARAARLKQSFAQSGGVTAVAGAPMEAWRGANRTDGDMIFFAKGRYAVALVHPPSPPIEFLKALVSSIQN
jgi:hypothetical protein